MPIARRKNEDFFKEWSPEMAYVLGFFAADGYMIKNNRGAHFIDFYSNDRELLENIRKAIGSDHAITKRQRNALTHRDSYKLQIGSKEWFMDLGKLGFMQKKSRRMHFPQVPKKYLGHFIRGYFDGDGCVSVGRYWRKDRQKWKWQFSSCFTSGNKGFLEDLLQVLRPFVKGGTIHEKGNDSGYDLVFSQYDSLALFRLMYHNVSASAYLKRKHDTFQKAFVILGLRA